MSQEKECIKVKMQLIAVPCLPGDHLYYIIPGEPGDELNSPHVFEDICTDVSTKAIFGKDARYEKSEIGVDLFFNEEEAQATLEQRYFKKEKPPDGLVNRCGNCKFYKRNMQYSTYGYCSLKEIVAENYIGVNTKSCEKHEWRGY